MISRRKISEIWDLRMAIEERSMYEPMSGCLLWIGGLDGSGYGAIRFRDKQQKAHRMSYLVFIGEPKNEVILHKCDNKTCVNPDHLKDASYKENSIDYVNKKRGVNMHLDYGKKEFCVNGHKISEFGEIICKSTSSYGAVSYRPSCRECNRIAVLKCSNKRKLKI